MTKATKKLVFAFFVALLMAGTREARAADFTMPPSLPYTTDGHTYTNYIAHRVTSNVCRLIFYEDTATYNSSSYTGHPTSGTLGTPLIAGVGFTKWGFGIYGSDGKSTQFYNTSCNNATPVASDWLGMSQTTFGSNYEITVANDGGTEVSWARSSRPVVRYDTSDTLLSGDAYSGPADITSFVLSTTTKTLHVTGHFNVASSSDPANSQALFVTRSDNVNALLPLDFGAGNPIFATTTGAFDYWFTNIDLTLVTGPDFGQYSFYGTTTFRAELQQWTASVASVLTSTSTSLATVTTQSVVGNGVGLDQTYGTTTLPDTGNLLSFLNVPQLLSTKVPFGYFFEAKEGIQSALSGSSTQSIPSGRITYNLGLGTTSVDMFSTTTIGVFVPPSTASLLRQLMVAALVAEVAYVLYLRGKSHHLI